MKNSQRTDFYINRNIKLSPSLISLTWDVIFVWTISNLYFTSVKGLTNSQTVLLDSILMLFGCLFCVPVGKIFQNVTPIKATRIGLLGYMVYLLLCIFGNSYFMFILAQPFLAFGYAVISVKTNSVLTQSLSVVNRDKDYQRIYGKGLSMFYVIECLGAIFITYVYDLNPALVYVISLAVVGIAELLSFLFVEPAKFMDKNVDLLAKEDSDKQKKPDKISRILKSTFLISVLIYCFVIRGVLSITTTSFKIFLNGLVNQGTIPLWSFGFIYAGSRICSALSSKYQFKFNLKFGLRSLLIINLAIVLGFIITGVTYLINPTSIISIMIIVVASYILCAVRMPNQIFINNYLQVCSPRKNIEKIYSLKVMVEYMGYAVISFIYSFLLSFFGDNYGLTNLVYIGIFTIPLIAALIFLIRNLTKKYAQKYTIIKDEYVND